MRPLATQHVPGEARFAVGVASAVFACLAAGLWAMFERPSLGRDLLGWAAGAAGAAGAWWPTRFFLRRFGARTRAQAVALTLPMQADPGPLAATVWTVFAVCLGALSYGILSAANSVGLNAPFTELPCAIVRISESLDGSNLVAEYRCSASGGIDLKDAMTVPAGDAARKRFRAGALFIKRARRGRLGVWVAQSRFIDALDWASE